MSTETEPESGAATEEENVSGAAIPSPRAWEEKNPSERLTAWLTSLVRNREYGQLAELRRPRVRTNTRIRAGWFDPDRREVFEEVAFLFAVYHRGASRPSYGFGSLGAATRRIGGGAGRGPGDPGASRLIDRIVSSRRIPWRHLQHAIARLRSCEQAPPNWTQLADDLGRWNDRKADIANGWAVDFHEPSFRSGKNAPTADETSGPPADMTADITADTIKKGTTK
ncbi:type I-E CRISPR-associated protein Cse2/CasB [Streptomyces sp. Isolate_45]|uniref:type I-E CRISPR-associated protein Cse2/CasB n=1 Tax=unclassified Streptomyces TaxID=2593676 RepID=UPI002481BA90|nr:type I-E CRISPR-associated protein Cse2/CasB [Streptomyces sp. Isolate_45]MDA5285531.1 type I-E CRISPR-associated protein Cse2/CasB [Streptomyces sp. Isolate_45]